MTSESVKQFLNQKLEERSKQGLLRTLGKVNLHLIDFSSNDYLGLARSKELTMAIHDEYLKLESPGNGATGSRLLTGNSVLAEEVEKKLSEIFNAEACLLFNSGYSANVAVLSCIPQKNDTIIYDELAHACIKDGARLSRAKRYKFRHNDLNDLEGKLKRSSGNIFVVVESVYSMDGDTCPLVPILNICEKYSANLIIDEAHSTGVIGDAGSGLTVSMKLENSVLARIYTFGKAMGVYGACVAGSKKMIDYLINHARPLIYTTALPPHSVIAIDCAFKYLANNSMLQQSLKNKINLFKEKMSPNTVGTKSTSVIQTLIVGGNTETKKASNFLQQKGFDIRPILAPTVPSGTERLRICLHTFNDDNEIISLTDSLNEMNQR